jgi:glycosyltransferase involved in cell wall biosynthesis
MRRARAFVFAAQEDFGITPVEAQACGTPVIAFGQGGAVESIHGLDQSEPTGVFFHVQSADAIVQAVDLFEQNIQRIFPRACRTAAERFRIERFHAEFSNFVNEQWEQFQQSRRNNHPSWG